MVSKINHYWVVALLRAVFFFRTPLHCAVVYTNLEMIRYLVHQGASLFMMTKDGDTSLKIITEDYKSQKEEDKDSEKASQLVACLHYLAGKIRRLTDQ